MLATLALLSLLTLPGRDPLPRPASLYRPRVEVWTNRGDDAYTSGQAVRVYFRAEQDAFVTVLRVDTDGRVRVLFPREPWEDNFVRSGREYEIQGSFSRDAFSVDDYPGVGYVFAIAAGDPFVYDAIESGDHWDYRLIADGRVRGDPYVALTDLAQRLVPDGYTDWDYDVVPYYVQQHYDYPRFLCYDCHTYVSYPYWSPYDYTCIRFRIVVFDDPYYYPYRYYGGTRVVFTRPLRPEPRFIFKDRQRADLFITRVQQRPVNDDRRRDVGVRGRDLGRTGSVPVPLVPRERPITPRERPITGDESRPNVTPRQRPITGDQDEGDRGRGRGRQPERPDAPAQPDRPDRPAWRDNPHNPERPERPARPERRAQPGRDVPPDGGRPERRRPEPPVMFQPERPRPEPRREPEARPQIERRAPPRVQPAAPPPPPPRSEPRVEPKRDAPRERPRSEPELKRRKP